MLTSKQRAYLRGLANTEEPILHAGKGGISDAMLKQADDASAQSMSRLTGGLNLGGFGF